MRWRKLGKVFAPDQLRYKPEWMKTHATLPFADYLEADLFKIYFSSRDKKNRSFTAYLVIDVCNPANILEISEQPVLSPGPLGTFDDSGAMASCLLRVGQKKYLYYIGWNLGVTVPFRNSIGLAISEDNGKTFTKYASGPVLDRTPAEPYFTASCCVMADNSLFRIWYLSCTKWEEAELRPQHYYHIKYAESHDGINWRRNGIVALDFKDSEEYAISCPRVIQEKGMYTMWYCFRGGAYRIGYAESADGIIWQRKDHQAGIDVSSSGWDNEMICYPFVFQHKGAKYMLYNGNNYGGSGLGLAVLE